MLAEYRSALALSHLGPTPIVGAELAVVATIEFLEININELKRLLADVEACCEQASARAWQGYLDRQSGI